tara:strand:+ start:170 stop:529 length:360 start_codon:yes stop_codon:yes gene_type:complete
MARVTIMANTTKAQLEQMVKELTAQLEEAKKQSNFNRVKGLHFKQQDTDYFSAKLGLKLEEFIPYAKENANDKGYLNLYMTTSKKSGKVYIKLDKALTKQESQSAQESQANQELEEMPF